MVLWVIRAGSLSRNNTYKLCVECSGGHVGLEGGAVVLEWLACRPPNNARCCTDAGRCETQKERKCPREFSWAGRAYGPQGWRTSPGSSVCVSTLQARKWLDEVQGFVFKVNWSGAQSSKSVLLCRAGLITCTVVQSGNYTPWSAATVSHISSEFFRVPQTSFENSSIVDWALHNYECFHRYVS